MKQMKYKVEAFIVPAVNDYCVNNTIPQIVTTVNIVNETLNYTDDFKNESLSTEEENLQNLKNTITLEKNFESKHTDTNEEKHASINLYSPLAVSKYEESYNVDAIHYPLNVLEKVHKLTPIDEKSDETEDKLSDLCYHGCKNGCSAIVPTPQQVSEEVFQENWLHKLEDINKREALLRNRESILRNRETALLKKEKEIKILERILKYKFKKLDLQMKENKNTQNTLNVHNSQKNNLASSISVDSKETSNQESYKNDVCTEKLDNIDSNRLNPCIHNEYTESVGVYKDLQPERGNWSSSCSSDSIIQEKKKLKQRSNLKSSSTLKLSSSKLSYDCSNKLKKSSKIYYEDLDTTLSADIGDSSFVQTSQKFNPELYKKPYAFTRSASERHIRYIRNKNDMNFESQNTGNMKKELQPSNEIEENKVLERFAKNISVSQDKSTKYQHYGPIDQNPESISKTYAIENDEKYSYLNLETGNQLPSQQKLIRGLKDRPTSWNEETNEWLQKKRKAYNMATKKVPTEDTENKENQKYDTKSKAEKVIRKKDIKNKIFTIFR